MHFLWCVMQAAKDHERHSRLLLQQNSQLLAELGEFAQTNKHLANQLAAAESVVADLTLHNMHEGQQAAGDEQHEQQTSLSAAGAAAAVKGPIGGKCRSPASPKQLSSSSSGINSGSIRSSSSPRARKGTGVSAAAGVLLPGSTGRLLAAVMADGETRLEALQSQLESSQKVVARQADMIGQLQQGMKQQKTQAEAAAAVLAAASVLSSQHHWSDSGSPNKAAAAARATAPASSSAYSEAIATAAAALLGGGGSSPGTAATFYGDGSGRFAGGAHMTMTYPWAHTATSTTTSSSSSSMSFAAKGAADAAQASTIRPATASPCGGGRGRRSSGGGGGVLQGSRSASSSPTKFTVVGSTSGRLSTVTTAAAVSSAYSGNPGQHSSRSPTFNNQPQRVLVGLLAGRSSPSPGTGSPSGRLVSTVAGGALMGHGAGVITNSAAQPYTGVGGEVLGAGLPPGRIVRSPSPASSPQKRRPTSAAGVGMKSLVKEDLAAWRNYKG